MNSGGFMSHALQISTNIHLIGSQRKWEHFKIHGYATFKSTIVQNKVLAEFLPAFLCPLVAKVSLATTEDAFVYLKAHLTAPGYCCWGLIGKNARSHRHDTDIMAHSVLFICLDYYSEYYFGLVFLFKPVESSLYLVVALLHVVLENTSQVVERSSCELWYK